MIYLEYCNHNGDPSDYFITMSDQYGLKDLLETHYEINNVYEVGNIIGFSEYSKNELGIEIFYKGQDSNYQDEEFKNKSKTLFINNIEIRILEQMFNILMCINVGESALDSVIDNIYKYIRTYVEGIIYLDDDADNYITLAYGANDEDVLNDLLFQCTNEYVGFIRAIIKQHKKRIIKETGCMDITQCVNNLDTGFHIEAIDADHTPSTVILYEYNTVESFHSTDMSNMFSDEDDIIISFFICYKLYAPKKYYEVVKGANGYMFKEIVSY